MELKKPRGFQRFAFLFCSLSISMLMISACANPNGSSSNSSSPGVTANSIRVAAIGGLSGPGSYVGKAATAGFHDYMNLVNEAGGVKGRKIEIVDIDHASDPGKAVAAVNQAEKRENVFAMWVESSPAALAVASNVEREKVPTLVISPTSSIYDPPKRYLFTVGAPYAVEAARAVDFIMNELVKNKKDAKIAWIGMDEASGQSMHDGAKAALEGYGHTFVTEQFIQRGNTNVSSQVLNIKQSGAQYVMMGTLTQEGAAVLKEAEKNGLNAVFIGSSFITSDVQMFKLAGDRYIDQFYGVWPIRFWDDSDPIIQQLKAAAEKNGHKEYVEIKSPYYLFGAFAAYIMKEAMNNADELTREGLVAGYEKLHQYPMKGFVDTITYSPTQRIPLTKDRVVKVVKSGDAYTLSEVSSFQEPTQIRKLGLPWMKQ